MAFLLLAASARDDTLLFLQKMPRHRKNQPRRPLPTMHDNGEDDDDDSFKSLPPSWNSQVDHNSSNSKQDRHHHSLLSFWRKPRFALSNTSTSPWTTTKKDTWRQRRHIRSSADEIQSSVEARLKEAPFLSSQLKQDDAEPPLLSVSRRDVTLRYWLGHGGFCKVWEVDFADKAILTKTNGQAIVFKHARASLLQDRHREYRPNHHHQHHHHHHHHRSKTSSPHQNQTNAFVHGAVDLRMEALYLSHLHHPNIIHIFGLVQPSHGLLPYRDGRHDGFGLLLESLSDTLDQRIEDWRRTSCYYYYRDTKGDLSSVTGKNTSSSAGQLYHGHNIFSSSTTLRKVHLGRVLHYAEQLADALQYLHDRRIVACDVKPSNVGFVDEHQIRLFDLGLCRELPPIEHIVVGGTVDVDEVDPVATSTANKDKVEDEQHRLYELPTAGTPAYLPGEVLYEGRYNCLADVYSWAVVLYEMLTLQKPFESLTPSEHFELVALRGERPPLNNDKVIPPAFHALLTHAWDPDVSKRWTMRQVREELARIRESLDIISPTTPTNSSSSSPRRHHHQRRRSSLEYLDLEVSSRQDDCEDGDEKEEPQPVMTADDFERLCRRYG